ncbi:hypothetical protein, partial [Azospirillum griseum]|uniref:hypothetical protein n=1 Tax=Azospirillum griseum TaxID=2496639 RepID=UPI003CCC6775
HRGLGFSGATFLPRCTAPANLSLIYAPRSIANLFHLRRDHRPVADYRKARAQAFQVWAEVTGAPLAA